MNRESAVQYLKSLRDKIIHEFESIEESKETFQRKTWDYSKGIGGGEMSVLRAKTFEKAAVNWSGVGGDSFPMKDGQGSFFATGVSLITHMNNPKMPTVHMNVRYIETEKEQWFGGGYDLTPMGFENDEDTQHFHSVAKKSLDAVDPELYQKYSNWAREYFFIKHYNKERGVGGLFFDHLDSGHKEKDVATWKAVGDSFLESIMPIYKKKITQDYTEEDKEAQLKARAHYVEFNLLYDRGTKFGFQSGGNPEAILCSMPPLVRW